MEERVQKIMSQAGLGSRRDCEELIRAGRVRVNGRPIHLGDKADPNVDEIEVDGRRLPRPEKFTYVAVNKPKGVLSSTEDELGEGRPTVRDLLPFPGHLYPVGRLDKQSEGLMLLTNDGALAHRLTHPRYEHEKTYRVVVEGRPSPDLLEEWRRGVLLDGRPTAPAQIDVIEQNAACAILRVVLREGRKRQIRRVAAQLGHPVQQLLREQIGPLRLGDLPPGHWRYLTAEEVATLRRLTENEE
ncbi:MAG: pseudouridine synthase [Chloroflexota bacterium]